MTTPIAPDMPDISTFGGTFVDLDPVIDATTEQSAAQYNAHVAQTVADAHTAFRAWARVTVTGTTPAVVDHDAMWGGTPGVIPAASRTSIGIYVLQWATSYYDLRATPESHAVNIRSAQAHAAGSTSLIYSAVVTDARTVTIYCFTPSTNAAAEATTFEVSWR